MLAALMLTVLMLMVLETRWHLDGDVTFRRSSKGPGRIRHLEGVAQAGIVTTDDGPFLAMPSASTPLVRDLGVAARSLIFDAYPATVEVVWPHQRTAGYGVGPKKVTQQFVWLAPHASHLVFGFYEGAQLLEGADVLSGTGARTGHAKIRAVAELSDPALVAVLREAIARKATALAP
jgi:hypothetical protein